ncbi:hypothetical protein BOTBODRAFT_35431 [Botryobasidium botryosum FD-172 SS1]|uniref:F-box domain-containing protein n=1 Tax=Botryobasidium botryosum (strain FD-172 SS1) TaxID=930990 RepID=A0A067M747_BOTB1|nr:hypothetical protein BOTBODRAFT_35431 [Botryobasidium botryosum FD-172 SS1]
MEVDATPTPAFAHRELPRDVVHNLYRQCDQEDMVRLSHVCQLWRQTLHDYTGFWSQIDLDLDKRDPDLKAAYWLERAGQRPLAIDVCTDWGDGDFETQERSTMEYFTVRLGIVLRGCMDRWQSFKVRAHLRTLDVLLPIFAGYTPELTFLSIVATGEPTISVDTERPLIPLLAPTGQQDGAPLSVSIESYIPRFTTFGSSITELSVEGTHDTPWTSNDILRIFQSCPNLVDCSLCLPGTDVIGRPLFDGFVLLSQLITFSVSWVQDIENVLNILRLPALESITLHEVNWTTAAMSALWSLFGSSHSLASIVLTDEETAYVEKFVIPAPFHVNTLTLDSLTYLEVVGNPLVRPLLEHIVLPHAETLHLTSFPFRTVHRLILTSPDLDELWLSDITLIPISTNRTPVTLAALRTLQLRNCPSLLNHIHAPQLKSLRLFNSHSAVARSGASLCALIKRSAPDLTVLYLRAIDITDQEMLHCLERLSGLNSLMLNSCTISDTVLRALAVPPSPEGGTGWLLPCLKTVQLYQNANITPQAVVELLASRRSSRKSRIKCNVNFAHKLSDEDVKALSSYPRSLTFRV